MVGRCGRPGRAPLGKVDKEPLKICVFKKILINLIYL